MKKLILLPVVFTLHTLAFSQIGIGTQNPNPSALLELNVSSYPANGKKGFLPPRMTADERMGIASPAEGLVVYNTTENCINFFNGTGWVSICDDSIVFPPFPLNARFGGSGNDQAFYSSIKQTTDGGFFIAGQSTSSNSGDVSGTNHGGSDFWVVKLDAAGNKTWDKLLGGTANDGAYACQLTIDNGYIITGYSESPISGDVTEGNNGQRDIWVVKLDTAGNKTWDRQLGGFSNDHSFIVQQTTDGGYMVAGYSQSSISGDVSETNHGSNDYWVVKLDIAGNKTWDKLLGGSGDDRGVSAQQTKDGGYIIAGHSLSSNSGDVSGTNHGGSDFWVVKLDAAGNKIWDKLLGGAAEDRAYAIQQTSDGGYVIAGYSSSSASGDVSGINHGGYDYWIVKLDAAGNQIWDKLLGGTADDIDYSVIQTTDGGYILAGYSSSSASGDISGTNYGSNDFWVVKLDASGNIIWDKLLGGSGNDMVYAVHQTTEGGYVIIGDSRHASAGNGDQTGLTGRGNLDIWVVRIDENGDIIQ